MSASRDTSDMAFAKWCIDRGYTPQDVAANRSELYNQFMGKSNGQTKQKRDYEVRILVDGEEVCNLGTMQGRKRDFANAAYVWLLANGHGFDREEMAKVQVHTTLVEVKEEKFSILSELKD